MRGRGRKGSISGATGATMGAYRRPKSAPRELSDSALLRQAMRDAERHQAQSSRERRRAAADAENRRHEP